MWQWDTGRRVKRITPACAGKSPSATQEAAWLRDHPRVCREKKPIWKNCSASSGSPPRVRGKVCDASDFGYVFRITPACAGKRGSIRKQNGTVRDHPRVCGEKVRRLARIINCNGSPPRVRGKAKRITVPSASVGITPACAGKSIWHPTPETPRWDHPRVCGEKCDCDGHMMASFGITPACAGKSTSDAALPPCTGDHPRVCGEKDRAHRHLHDALGSPPRVRGKGGRGAGIRTGAGITPACAGKSKASRNTAAQFWDHPRVCGEKR